MVILACPNLRATLAIDTPANNKSDGVFFKKEGEDAKQKCECSHNCLTACEEQC